MIANPCDTNFHKLVEKETSINDIIEKKTKGLSLEHVCDGILKVSVVRLIIFHRKNRIRSLKICQDFIRKVALLPGITKRY